MTDIIDETQAQRQPKNIDVPNLNSLEALDSHETVVHHEETQTPITRIVFIAIDQSSHSSFAFDWAAENFFKPASDFVILANVRPIVSIPDPYAFIMTKTIADPSAHHHRPYPHLYYSYQQIHHSYPSYSTLSSEIYNADLTSLGTTYMNFSDFIGNLEEQIACKAIAMRGDPRDEIVRKVQELNADVLIMGSRGLGTLKRYVA
ncbi:hypothetical protein BC937DRAFT_94398 [Endogone sp. FLAS-F59071]|nr:hypothetical protein BC937DRAFT_94398 [Endogone sp. FLAS-F59071]|eukprot:RUS20782.1 hypothetical protein BC937DRAFT_94398 [Endogone sp. FLAS-F59071]